jgi:hypothetical protein
LSKDLKNWGSIDKLSNRFDLLKEEYSKGAEVTDAEYLLIWIKFPEMASGTFRVWAACRYMFLDQLTKDPDENVRHIATTADFEWHAALKNH